ncbi:MAG: heme o synthase [Frankiaceae bacterium]
MTSVASRAAALDAPLRPRRSLTGTVRAYVALTKPRIIELLLVTTLPAMVLAAGGLPGLRIAAVTMLGGTLAAGSANALNCYLDRDIDVLMRRTERRPLATATVSPHEAVIFGLVLGAISVGMFAATVNLLSAALTAAAILFYVLIYTAMLKRNTSSNIVWGGAAGCMPTLIGWSAVTGRLAWAPVVLFAIVFFWTPPHFWALALRFRDDYALAGVPMLPVVAEDRTVTRRIVAYSWVMVAVSLLLWPVAGTGWLYPAAAATLGAAFLLAAHRLHRAVRRGAAAQPMRLFSLSISYLTLLFVAVAVDTLIFG